MYIDTKKIIDISMNLDEKTVVWKYDAQPKLEALARIPKDPVNFTWLNFGSHAGTHIDAPFYLFNNKWTSDQVPFDRLIGRCQVIDLTHIDDIITAKDLEKIKITQQKILMKTKNSYDPMIAFNPNHIAMDESAAKYLVGIGVQTLGYDYQSFERDGKCDIHRILLEKDIVVIDNLRLIEAKPKEYQLICLPIKIIGIDGAPTRAILIDED